MTFAFQEQQIVGRVIDTSRTALKSPFLPQSLGVRPQALELRLAGPDSRGDFVRHQLQLRDVLPELDLPGDGRPARAQQPAAGPGRIFIGETASLIYAPYVRRAGGLYDPFGQQVIELPEAAGTYDLFSLAQPADWAVRFIATLCPACGWDLSGEKESCVLVCRQCATAWEATAEGFHKVAWGLMSGSSSQDLAVPFWRIRADLQGIRLETRADLSRLANLSRTGQQGSAEGAALFWVPAFKVQPKLFLRLARLMTALQPDDALMTGPEDLPLYPVTLPAAEASGAIALTLAAIAADKRRVYSLLPELRTTLREAVLVYVPFSLQGNELIQKRFGFGLSRAALRLGMKI